MGPIQEPNLDTRLKQLECNCVEILSDALGFIAELTSYPKTGGLAAQISSNFAAKDTLSEEEFDMAIRLRSNLALLKQLMKIPGSPRGIQDLCEYVKGREELAIRALDALEKLCVSEDLYKRFLGFSQISPENMSKAVPLISNAIRKQM
jgi:hypothetical protein